MAAPPSESVKPEDKIDRAELEQAFSLFTEASRQLVESYHELEQKVSSLTDELAVANGALRQQFEEKVALSGRLEALLAALPGGVVELDTDEQVITMNPAAEKILGRQLIGEDWRDAIQSGLVSTAVDSDWLFTTDSGQEKRLSIVTSQLTSGERILLIHDLSESWRLRRQLEQHKRLAAMGEMAAGLAHQLRTPLATALLYTASLAKPQLGEVERVKFGQKSLARLRHLEILIQNMLQFVRGQQALLEPVELRGVMEEALQIVQPQDTGNVRTWLLTLPDTEVWIEANRKELTSALVNLLENALQATGAGDQIALSLEREGDSWQMVISDSGCGMPENVRERLFEPFFTTRKEGTGLGLAIVRNLITAYGGDIDVHSMPGEGAKFTILLPAKE
ncbi:sensor histidine kinase [Chitinimonas sp. BJB300]|uniref:sensor histidine kinase n=1 Tax=Chitinimonas sp. BJB300 TaxID=1559339 RepID=UPI000C0F5386|nr:ATP-binding protein [Chitinimonas sp. BJB300]PHV13102.1 PAS domain-containing sensor histidine kinase [Chitinimonas sp. BJB300]TSJ84699.1 GHKL domain-containing protein [Chitinimonas sp. BJB300]